VDAAVVVAGVVVAVEAEDSSGCCCLPGNLEKADRFRTYLRWVGYNVEFFYRFHYRVMVEKEYTAVRSSIIPYLNAEPYWDSSYSDMNRIRLIGGATVACGPHLAYEANLTYQYDSHYTKTNLYAINVILHMNFETARAVTNAENYEQPPDNQPGENTFIVK
jgi:hypothetical protein